MTELPLHRKVCIGKPPSKNETEKRRQSLILPSKDEPTKSTEKVNKEKEKSPTNITLNEPPVITDVISIDNEGKLSHPIPVEKRPSTSPTQRVANPGEIIDWSKCDKDDPYCSQTFYSVEEFEEHNKLWHS